MESRPCIAGARASVSGQKGNLMEKPVSPSPIRVGIFSRLASADRAAHALVKAGFHKDEITVICPTCTTENFEEYTRREPAGAKTAGAATRGGAIGALLGGFVAVAGITLSGGVGVLVAGPMLATAAGGGAVAGSFVGAMMTRGLEREMANFYDQAVQKGKILVGVDCHGDDAQKRLVKAEKIFIREGAETLSLTEG
jgi:hypothetical protein